ncbi:hypothetical protein Lalb_Chr03g0042831 [Lupinus albus]|uniref:Uncharacterized protein n=1 Tax=Lupinus albus TaxID=3870 RepID=A0A6A4QYQ4_LUPAL|nr:hypothetical protein Lalb_Chr03g0042831 [Lupinus albus]
MAKAVKKSTRKNKSQLPSKLPEGIEHWIIRPMRRGNGKPYKIYIHKVKKITLRSVKEVERFETNGTLPTRKGKKNSKKRATLKKNSSRKVSQR